MTQIYTESVNLICATIIAMIVPLGTPISLVLCYYILFTPFRWCLLIYIAWFLLVESTVSKRGGKPVKNFLKPLWVRAEDYFRINTVFVGNFKLDPKRNYLLCGFPHGFIALSMQVFFNSKLFKKFCENHQNYSATLDLNFYIPFQRELMLAMGFISAGADSLKYILSKPSGGNVIGLLPGGSEEVFYTNPHNYKFFLKRRKGFVKIALLTGASLIPIISLGENKIYTLIDNLYLEKFGRLVKKFTGFSLVIPTGRWFSWIPNKSNIIVAGDKY